MILNYLYIPSLLKIRMMGYHGNGPTSHSTNRDFSLGQNSSHLVCPGERFSIHETLSWGRGVI